jgi:hypothetical protein
MPLAIFVFILKFVAEVVRMVVRRAREVKVEPLCLDCLHAHVQYASNGRRAISCGYGGAVRPMKLDVLYCTGYCPRSAPTRGRVIGFVREVAPAE